MTLLLIFFSNVNFDIRIHPLHEQNIGYYQKVIVDVRSRTDDSKNDGQIRQRDHRKRKKINDLVMVEDLSDDESYGVSIDVGIRENKKG